jgi:hypothetical protein
MPTDDAERGQGVDRPATVRVRFSLLVSLIAGRGSWRLAFIGANALLLSIWGAVRYADFASAMGTSTVLIPLVSAGVEKASLKLVPRARRSRPWLAGALLVIACAVALPVLAWFALGWLLGRGSNGPLQLVAGTFTSLLGVNVLLVALQRALGRPLRDVQSYVGLAAALLGAAGLAAVLPLSPIGVLLLMVAFLAVLNLWLLRSLRPAPRLRGLRRRTALLRCASGTAAMMSGHDLAAGATISLVFAALAGSRFHTQSAYLYLVVNAWAPVVAGFNYLLRVFQPQVSLALAGGVAAARRRARRLAGLVLGGWGIAAAVVAGGAALGAAGVLHWPPRLPLVVALAVLLVARGALFATGSGAVYLLENGDGRTLRLVAVAAGCGFAAVVAVVFPLVGRFGAVGAVLTLSAYDLVLASGLLLGTRRGRAAAPGPAADPSAAGLTGEAAGPAGGPAPAADPTTAGLWR